MGRQAPNQALKQSAGACSFSGIIAPDGDSGGAQLRHLRVPARSVNSFVAALSRNRESGSRSGVEGNRFCPGLLPPESGLYPANAVKPCEKRGKNAAFAEQSGTSHRCKLLCSVSATINQLPEKTCGKRTRWLTGAPVNQRVGLFSSHKVGPAKGGLQCCYCYCLRMVLGNPRPAHGGIIWTALVPGC